ncbi:hypothetical protein SDC9_136575 [bioreactor metagenome]|uniref:Uncharacterized protein n=1 Tax=bioreactor metagenome TaxID=1076179 RepID=A0A645DJI5_9ZZZZ
MVPGTCQTRACVPSRSVVTVTSCCSPFTSISSRTIPRAKGMEIKLPLWLSITFTAGSSESPTLSCTKKRCPSAENSPQRAPEITGITCPTGCPVSRFHSRRRRASSDTTMVRPSGLKRSSGVVMLCSSATLRASATLHTVMRPSLSPMASTLPSGVSCARPGVLSPSSSTLRVLISSRRQPLSSTWMMRLNTGSSANGGKSPSAGFHCMTCLPSATCQTPSVCASMRATIIFSSPLNIGSERDCTGSPRALPLCTS